METAKQLVDVFKTTLGSNKFTRRDIEKSDSGNILFDVNRGKKIIFPMLQNIVMNGNAWGDKFRDASLDNRFGEFGILQLFTNGHPLTGSNQLGQIGIQCMVREPRQLNKTGRTVCPSSKGDTANLGGLDGILSEGFVEIAHPK